MNAGPRLARGGLALLVVTALPVAALRSARADDVVPVQLDYEGSSVCPDADAFSREVLSRAPRARIAAGGEHARSFVARIRTTARGLEGVLVVREPGAAPTERTVHAQGCAELVTALAVIAAVVIDPMTAKSGALEATDGGSSGRPSAGQDAATAPASGGQPPAPATSSAPSPSASGSTTAPAPELLEPGAGAQAPHPLRRSWHFSAGAGAGIVAGAAPTVLFSVPVFVEVSRAGAGIVEPSVRFRFEQTSLGSVTQLDGGASFVRTGGALELCPIALHAPSLRAQPCLRTEVAALRARGRDVDPIRSDVRPWIAFGALARARFDLAGPLFAELEAALVVPVVRDRFFVEPSAFTYRPPAVGATGALDVGATF